MFIVVLLAFTPLPWLMDSPAGIHVESRPAGSRVSSTFVRDEVFERRFQQMLEAKDRPAVRLNGLRISTLPNVLAAEMENDWLTCHLLVAAKADGPKPPAAFDSDDPRLEEQVRAFGAMTVASRESVETTLRELGLELSETYAPATGPYFTNGRGLQWSRVDRRFVLVARGVEDRTSNRCFKAAIDLSTGNLISRQTVQCRMH